MCCPFGTNIAASASKSGASPLSQGLVWVKMVSEQKYVRSEVSMGPGEAGFRLSQILLVTFVLSRRMAWQFASLPPLTVPVPVILLRPLLNGV